MKQNTKADDFKLVHTGITDAAGKASFSDLATTISVLVKYQGKVLILPSVQLDTYSESSEIKSELLFDKTIVKPGDKLHVKGAMKPSAIAEALHVNKCSGVYFTG